VFQIRPCVHRINVMMSTRKKCIPDHIICRPPSHYDPVLKRCIPITCPPGFHPTPHGCERNIPICRPGFYIGPCVCPPGTHFKHGVCVKIVYRHHHDYEKVRTEVQTVIRNIIVNQTQATTTSQPSFLLLKYNAAMPASR
jgi:hypothetical protein